ncbi:MAG TPA: hypothetical protein VHA30_00390 [Patescibacteria group bacterium]|nr:hypothetical protein [Patescibacteria group bacterium]
MAIPWFSTFTLGTEILVTASILFIFASGYRRGRFPYALAAITLAYEVLFNISYMASRALGGANPSRLEPRPVLLLAAFHGIFSLFMFLALLAYLSMAWRQYRRGVNYFLRHRRLTLIFIILWLLAVLSGIAFYFFTYFF